MPEYQQQYFAIDGLDTLNTEEMAEIIRMAVYAIEKPVTLETSKGYINYPLFYPAIKNKGIGFLDLEKKFSKKNYGSILSSVEINQIIDSKSEISNLVELLYEHPIYGKAEIKKQSRGRPNKLLDASVELKLKENKVNTSLLYDIKGANSEKSDQILTQLPIKSLHHNLSVIEDNFTFIQEYVMNPDKYNELWSKRIEPPLFDGNSDLELLEIYSDWYWQVKFDEMRWSYIMRSDVNLIDPGDIISGAIKFGRHLGELSQPVIKDFGKIMTSRSDDLLEGVGDAIGGMLKGTTDMISDIDGDDDGAAAIMLIIGGVALTALLTTGVIYGGIAIRRELLDYNLIWLDNNGVFIPNKSRLPLQQLKDLENDKK